MGDNAEFEKLTTLEARLAAALDRIAVGLGEAMARPAPVEDPGLTSGAFEDAQIRADAAEAQIAPMRARAEAAEAQVSDMQGRVIDLEAQIATLLAVPPSVDEPLIDAEALAALRDELAAAQSDLVAAQTERDMQAGRAQALEAAREADRDETARTIAARDTDFAAREAEIAARDAEIAARDEVIAAHEAEIETLRADLAKPAPEPEPLDTSEIDALRASVRDLTAKVQRLHAEQAVAAAEHEDLQEAYEALQSGQGASGDGQMTAMREELQALRLANDRLLKNAERLRAAQGSGDMSVVNKSLATEFTALRAARMSEAAELERILKDLDNPEAEHA